MMRNTIFEQVTDFRGDTKRNRGEPGTFDRRDSATDDALRAGVRRREDLPSAAFEPRRSFR